MPFFIEKEQHGRAFPYTLTRVFRVLGRGWFFKGTSSLFVGVGLLVAAAMPVHGLDRSAWASQMTEAIRPMMQTPADLPPDGDPVSFKGLLYLQRLDESQPVTALATIHLDPQSASATLTLEAWEGVWVSWDPEGKATMQGYATQSADTIWPQLFFHQDGMQLGRGMAVPVLEMKGLIDIFANPDPSPTNPGQAAMTGPLQGTLRIGVRTVAVTGMLVVMNQHEP